MSSLNALPFYNLAPSGCDLNENGIERNKMAMKISRKCSTGCHVVLIVDEGKLPWDTKLNFSLAVSGDAGLNRIKQFAHITVTTNGLPRGGLLSFSIVLLQLSI